MTAPPDLQRVAVPPRHAPGAGVRSTILSDGDPTRLPGRAASLDLLAGALASARPSPVAVLVVDLDRFRLVNDSLGHDAGDGVLAAVAERLRGAIRPLDVVGRLAGDEFLVVCGPLEGEVDALGLADRVRRSLRAPVPVGGHDVVVTASVGVARDAAARPEDLVRDAALATAQAQALGGDRVVVFGRSMRARRVRRMEVERDLRDAMQTGLLDLHYQPTVRLADGRPTLVEALLRWRRGDERMPTAEFVAVAEDAGLIGELGRWALRRACSEIATWGRRDPTLRDVAVAVNLSARQFTEGGLVEAVADALEASQLDPARLWLEITETVLMADGGSTVETLSALRTLGVHLAVDDFGTGYSSLAYLRRFPVEVLKIDAAFVANLTGAHDPLVAAVVQLGHALGLRVVAEGIETGEQAAALSALGCDHGQGYLYAPALPAAAARQWVSERVSAVTGEAC